MLSRIVDKAKDLGFIAVGFCGPQRPLFFDSFKAWLAAKGHAGMSWLERHVDLRENPAKLLKDCRSIVSLAFPYPSERPATADGFYVSRYADPFKEDYHQRLKERCRGIANIIMKASPDCRVRVCVDSAPLLERSLALAAGLGFIGKNNMMILPGHGSYVYLAEILTTAPLPFEIVEPMDNQCGPCTRCIDACPTGALQKPFYIDASRCLSYRTIEYGGRIDPGSARAMGFCFFGCDRCQEACPFNQEKASTRILMPKTQEILQMDEDSFDRAYGKTALARGGLDRIKRNIRAVKDDANVSQP
ncbi:MAG: tRNA epoxyqueuosine(34) reductase QueG [Deltaproteobacteria bacterium]